MNYKRLNARLKGGNQSKFDRLEHAFEAEAQALQPAFVPQINHPTSNYDQEIAHIRKGDEKLGLTFQRLNQQQRHAVFHPTNYTLLAAMVGSGKTTVLIAKIFYLHFIQHVPFEKMVVLTFTNKAAREIKERIALFMGDGTQQKALRYFGTFHAVARQLLEEHPQLTSLGFKPGFLILDEQEKQNFLERIITQEGLRLKYQSKLAKRWKSFKETGSVLMGNMKEPDDLERLIELAEQEKRRNNCMDFDDLLEHALSLLQTKVHQPPEWIIVDEFQDCNAVQLDLIAGLKAEDSKLFFVGDPNQSIYAWRGSKEHIFKEVYAQGQATWMELPYNYRSTKSILGVAENLLLEQNSALIATRQAGNPIALVKHFDDQQEAFYLREQILKLQQEKEGKASVAILFRTHEQIKIVEAVFKQANIPMQLSKQHGIYADPVHTFLLHVFKLCCRPHDIDACLAVLCDKKFGIFKRSAKLIKALHRAEADQSALDAAILYVRQNKPEQLAFVYFLQQVKGFTQHFLTRDERQTNKLLSYLGLTELLKPTSVHHADYLQALDTAWTQLCLFMDQKSWGTPAETFLLALDQVVLEASFFINERQKEQGKGVHLMTIHAAKGLEFDHVFISGVNTGIVPLQRHQRSQNLKEEKRLLFVAITRGKNTVEMGWHVQPSFPQATPEPSYFLNAIPESLLERRVPASVADKETEQGATDEWTVHAPVLHKKYGKGTLIALTEEDIVCRFESVGEKTFSRAFAKALLSQDSNSCFNPFSDRP